MTDVYAARPVPSATDLVEGRHTHKRVSWSALFGGVVLVVSIQLLLSLLGAAIGFSTVDVNAGNTPSASTFGTGAGIWWVVSGCISLFIGGYASAWLAGVEIRFDGFLHGLVTWGIATLLTLYLLTSAVGGLIGGGFSALGGLTSTLGSGIKSAAAPIADAAGISPDMIRQQAQAFLSPTTATDPAAMSPQDAQKEVASNLVTYEKGGADAPAAKQRIVAITAAQLKISQADAEKKFDDAQAKIAQAKAQAEQTAKAAADATASAASKTGFAVFVDLLLGAIFAGIGGSVAVARRGTLRRV